MTTGAKYFIQIPTCGECSLINHGPFDTLPKTREAVERIKKRWSKFQHTTPPGMPSLMIVKVVEEQYVGVEK